MVDDSVSGFGFAAICRKYVTAAFDGERLTSDGGVLLPAQSDRAMGIAGRLSGCIADPRDQSRVVHGVADILQARIAAIACGYEDADELAYLRHDPGFKLAAGKLPSGVIGLASHPTMSCWENPPTTRELVRMMDVMVWRSYRSRWPKSWRTAANTASTAPQFAPTSELPVNAVYHQLLQPVDCSRGLE